MTTQNKCNQNALDEYWSYISLTNPELKRMMPTNGFIGSPITKKNAVNLSFTTVIYYNLKQKLKDEYSASLAGVVFRDPNKSSIYEYEPLMNVINAYSSNLIESNTDNYANGYERLFYLVGREMNVPNIFINGIEFFSAANINTYCKTSADVAMSIDNRVECALNELLPNLLNDIDAKFSNDFKDFKTVHSQYLQLYATNKGNNGLLDNFINNHKLLKDFYYIIHNIPILLMLSSSGIETLYQYYFSSTLNTNSSFASSFLWGFAQSASFINNTDPEKKLLYDYVIENGNIIKSLFNESDVRNLFNYNINFISIKKKSMLRTAMIFKCVKTAYFFITMKDENEVVLLGILKMKETYNFDSNKFDSDITYHWVVDKASLTIIHNNNKLLDDYPILTCIRGIDAPSGVTAIKSLPSRRTVPTQRLPAKQPLPNEVELEEEETKEADMSQQNIQDINTQKQLQQIVPPSNWSSTAIYVGLSTVLMAAFAIGKVASLGLLGGKTLKRKRYKKYTKKHRYRRTKN